MSAPGRIRLERVQQDSGVTDMDRLVTLVRWLATAEDGQDLLEYAMLCALIALVAMGAVSTLGNKINTVFWQAIAASNI